MGKTKKKSEFRKGTAAWAIFLVLFCTALTSSGQIMLKTASANLTFDLLSIITNVHLILGLIFYGAGAILLILAFKFGELSVLYPIIALGFVWVSLLSTRFLPVPEHMNLLKWLGIASIIVGVSLIGFGSQNGNAKASKEVNH